jgi:GT2 family glycosyltransferase
MHVCTNNRPTEVCLLLESLRKQTIQNWDLILLDDGSKNPIQNDQVFQRLINRIRLEKHCVKVIRNNEKTGVCNARNKCIEEDDFDNKYVCRVDDDVVLEKDYLERLLNVIKLGYDMSSGITPPIFQPEIKRRTNSVKPIINEIEYDDKGNLLHLGDDCGYSYFDKEIIPAHHLRSCFMYKKEVTDEGLRYEKGISNFREETFFCVRAMFEGFTMAVDTGAVVYHFISSTGGCRPDYKKFIQLDENTFKKFMNNMWHKDKKYLKKYNKKVEVIKNKYEKN